MEYERAEITIVEFEDMEILTDDNVTESVGITSYRDNSENRFV